MGQSGDTDDKVPEVKGGRIYDEAVRAAVILVWEASDRICDKRLKAALPHLVESMERHGHLDLAPEVRERLLAASAATLDRLLKPVRATVASRRNLQRGRHIPVRTQTTHYGDDWNKPPPGFLEIDLVAHCGDNWVEQKNGAVIRRFLGHERYSGQVAGQTIAHRHGVMRLYVNYFQPSFKLVEKTRNGSVTTTRYSPPATPCDRVIQHGRSAPRRRRHSVNAERPWTQWLYCTPSGKLNQPWRHWCPLNSARRQGARAWNGF